MSDAHGRHADNTEDGSYSAARAVAARQSLDFDMYLSHVLMKCFVY